MKNRVVNKIKRAVSLITIVFVFSIFADAQSNTGVITGVVTDQAGALVPSATVKVTNQATNETRTVQSDEEGRYEVPSLPTGIYTVEANATNFASATVTDLRLAVGEKARQHGHAASWKMMPRVKRRPRLSRLTPWRMVTR